ncbi:Imm50 family immunity protein [Streptomyces griseus]|nr:Imm50 family immunity protein [Streptomyces sp. ID01-9D]WSV22757.1 immunity 50 family protein [Streptomyces fimicarius]
MSTSEMRLPLWPELTALYETPPDLSSCPLYYVHVDERDTSVTLGFETARLPDRPRAEWVGKRYDTVRFFVVFTGVDELRITGIAAEPPDARDRTVRVVVADTGRQQVSVAGESRSISFSAATSAVTRSRVYLQGSP